MSATTIEAANASAVIATPETGLAVRRGFRPILRLIAKALREYHIRRATRERHGLDDRMLRDVGLNRGSIEYAVRCNATTGLISFGPQWIWITGQRD